MKLFDGNVLSRYYNCPGLSVLKATALPLPFHLAVLSPVFVSPYGSWMEAH